LEELDRAVEGSVAGFSGALAVGPVEEQVLNAEQRLRKRQELLRSRHQRRNRRRRPCWSGIDEVADAGRHENRLSKNGRRFPASTLSLASH